MPKSKLQIKSKIQTANNFRVKSNRLTGSSWSEIAPQARNLLHKLARRTKRQPYLRSAYFHKDKVFLTHFWHHLSQKNPVERTKRLSFLPCAIELIRNSKHHPTSKQNPNKPSEILHRFHGITARGEGFAVQIKEHKRTSRKELMSIFSYNIKPPAR